MMYEVRVDFGDNAIQDPKRLWTLGELDAYIERIPHMMGFEMNKQATVSIKMIQGPINQIRLPIDGLKA